jgi:Fe-S-cluster-containing dehydrogenase component
MKAFVMDCARCCGCWGCQIACKDEHCGNDWTPFAKPQPDYGQFWGKLHDFEMGQQPQVKVGYVFVPCQHCNNAPCVDACPNASIYVDDNGMVIINPKTCSGCQLCMDACPYNVIFFNSTLNIAQKCTGCAHLIAKGWTEPRCVDQCHQLCISYGEESSLDTTGAETWHAEYGLDTKFYYKNLPKPFIAGTVYDPDSKEVIIGATCTLSGGGSASATTNDYGDFWLENLAEADYTLTISSGGKTKTLDVSTKDGAKGLGDIALS